MNFEIKEVPITLVAFKRGEGKFKEVIPQYFMELFMAVADKCVGAPLFVCHNTEATDSGEIDCCVPISEKTDFGEGIEVRELPSIKVLSAVYKGPYDKVAPAYVECMKYIKENGLELSGEPSREVYLNDPRKVAPEELLTEIQFAIK